MAIVSAAALAACGQSERVGWAGRENPGGQAVSAESISDSPGEAGPAQRPAASAEIEAIAGEYELLFESLTALRQRAFQDPEVVATWAALIEDVDVRILASSEFHRQLIERSEAIAARLESLRATGATLDPTERAEMARHVSNIQTEMARVRDIELQQPEFLPRLLEFHALMYDTMRELDREREAEINRMQELGDRLMAAQETPSRDRTLQLRLPENVEPTVIDPSRGFPIP